MKLPHTLLGALAVALSSLAVTGCSDLISISPKSRPLSKPTPKPSTGNEPTDGKGQGVGEVGPDGCPINPGGGRRNTDPCPGCGRG